MNTGIHLQKLIVSEILDPLMYLQILYTRVSIVEVCLIKNNN